MLTPEQARELAKSGQWTIPALLDKLPDVNPWWMRDALEHFDGDRAELEARLVQRMEMQTEELPRVYMGLVLVFLGHPLGKAAFLDGLHSDSPQVRELVLDQLRVFRPDDLGRDGQPGKLPASREEVCAALAPFLRDPATKEGQIALDFILDHGGFAGARPQLQPLLRHADPAVRDVVLRAYLRHGVDDGALALLAAELLEPAVSEREKTAQWRQARRDDCRALQDCAKATSDGELRRRVGALALRVVRETLAAPYMVAQIDGWLEIDALLQTLVLAQPEGAATVLRQAIETESAPVSLRSQAVLRYFELTGEKPDGAGAVLRQMLQTPATRASSECLAQFVRRGLVPMDRLAAAAATPGWTYEVTQAIKAWPRGADDALAVRALITALRRLAKTQHDLSDLAETLYLLPRTDADNQAIIAALRVALERARQDTARPWIVKRPLRQLWMFGDLSVAEEDELDPWDAMRAHWQRNGWILTDVARLLAEAGVMDAVDETVTVGLTCKPDNPQGQILELLWREESDQHIAYQSIRDNGFEPEHDQLFGQLAAIVRPPLKLESLSQTWDHQWTEIDLPLECVELLPNGETRPTGKFPNVIPVYSTEGSSVLVRFVYQGQVYRFLAYPSGTWMDVWAVLDAFDRFMEQIGRPERAFWLAPPLGDCGEWGLFICAPAERFAEANAKLRLPLQPRKT